ncbi:UNVERIFIED_CONTAM: hypothetical protein RMT77_000880 [Armadillidium vulgare]
MEEECLSLTWNNHGATYQEMLNHLRIQNILTDCTLACDGQKFSVHKLVLVTCSDFFKSLLGDVACQHPIIYLRGVNGIEMQSLIDFMYLGKIDVPHKDVPNLISTAETLKIKGLGVFNLNIYDRKDVSERMDLKRKRTCLTSNFNESSKHNRTSSPLSKQTPFESNLLSKSKSSDEVETLPVIPQCSGENAQESSKNKYLQEKDKNELLDKNISNDSILNSLLRGTSFNSTSSNISNLETSVITNSCIITSENDLPPKEPLTLTQLTALQPFAEKPSKTPINNFYDSRGQNEETKLVSFAYVAGEKIRTSEILEGLTAEVKEEAIDYTRKEIAENSSVATVCNSDVAGEHFKVDESSRIIKHLSKNSTSQHTCSQDENVIMETGTELGRPFLCPICRKSFAKVAILKRHHLAHFRPYNCHLCPRSFTRREVLAEHVLEHNGADLRLPCPVCKMTIKRKRNLQAHIKVKHPEYHKQKAANKEALF